MNWSVCENLRSGFSKGVYGPLGGKLSPYRWHSEDELEAFLMKTSSHALVQEVHDVLCQTFEVVGNWCEGVLELVRALAQCGFFI